MLGAILVTNDIAVNKKPYILVGLVHQLKFKYEGGNADHIVIQTHLD